MVDDAWLALVRLAQATGDVSSLFPPGITHLADLPFTHHQAILSAMNFLSFNELPKEEKPPKEIWLDGDKMEAWWAEVERMRDVKYGGGGDQSQMDTGGLSIKDLIQE